MTKCGLPLLFPNGELYYIQGMPLGNIEEQYPDLSKALENDDDIMEQAYQMVRLQNPEVDKKSFRVDIPTFKKMKLIWLGQEDELNTKELKKKT